VNIDELTIREVRELTALINLPSGKIGHPWLIGKDYAIRTVTMILTGTLISVDESELVIENAAWVADTGRFSEFLKEPTKANEIEPFPDGPVIVGRNSVIDAFQIQGKLRLVK